MRLIIVALLSMMVGFSPLQGMVEKEISTELAFDGNILDFLTAPLDYMYYTDPLTIYPGLNRIQIRYAESMCFGLTPMYFKGIVRFKFIWDPDSVCAGDSFRLYIVAYTDTVYETDPYHGGRHEAYSNFGFSISMGFQKRKYNFSKFRYDEWEDLPIGLGFDGNLHIEGDGRLPLSGDTLDGEDELTITGIGMDIFFPEGGGGSGGKSIPDSLSKSDSDVTPSDLLGLIDLLSVNFGFGIRIRDGYITARLTPTSGNFYLSSPYELTWHHQGDTQMVWVHVSPHAIHDHFGGVLRLAGSYVAPYSWRGFETIHLMGIEIGRISSDWVEEENPVWINFSHHELEEVYIPLTGESHVPTHPDVRIEDVRVTTFESRLPSPQYITPEVGKTSFINLEVTNIGDGDLWGFSLKIIYPDTVHTISYHDTTIYPNGMISVTDTYTWRNPGLYEVRFIVIPDSGNNQVNFSNDTLNVKVFVRKKNILARISVVDPETGNHIPISSNYYSRINVIGMRTNTVAVPDTLGTGIYWLALIPSDDTVNITAIPDSSHGELFMTTRRVRMDTVSSDTLNVNLILWGRGTAQGYVFLPDSSPAESAMVSISEINRVFTDSTGFFIFQNLPQTDSITGRYRLEVYFPGKISINDSFYLPRNDTVNLTFYLENYDTIPPEGRVEVDSVVTRNFAIHLFSRDTLTASGDTIPPASVLIRDNLSSWDTIPYGMSFEKTVEWTVHTRTNRNEVDTVFVKFVDDAGNISPVIIQPVVVDQEGPYGEFTINHGDSVTFNTTIRITDVSIDSTLVPVKEINIRELGGLSMSYPFVPGEEYSFRIFNNYIEGDHIIAVRFVDSLGVSSEETFDTIFVRNYGSVYINEDEQFTNASVVDLTIDAYRILAHNTVGDQQIGGYPVAQSFIPHENQIIGAKVLFESAESGIKIAIFTLIHDTTYDQDMPGEMLAYQELSHQITTPEIIEINFDPPVYVNPESTYFLVIFKDSIEEGYTNFRVIAGNDENYAEGSLYGSPMKGLMWYSMDADMCFIIEGSLDSMKISNTPDFNSNWIPFQRIYHNWELEPGEGLRVVFVKVRGGDFERTFHDEIYVDKTPPDTGWIRLLNHGAFLETTQCTLLVGGSDSYSGMGNYRINNSDWLPFLEPPFTIVFNVDSGPPGPRSITAVFRDKAGNFYAYPDSIVIDFDPYGPSGRLIVGNNGVSSSETVAVHIELDKYKGKYISIDSIRFSFDRVHWGEWGPFTTDTVFILPDLGINPVYAELMDNHGRRNVLLGTCIVDTSPPEPVINVSDEGDLTENHSYLAFSWNCQGDFESGIDHFIVKISEDPQVNNVLYQFDVPASVRNYSVGPMALSGGSMYFAKIIAVNRVGLTRESEPTDGITVVNGIQQFTLISPPDSSNFRQGDTVRFVWHEAQDFISTITEYSVFIDNQIVTNVSDTSFQYVLNLETGWHRWYVVARDSLLDQRSSDTLNFHVGSFNPPPTPTAISPSDTAFNYDTVRFVWSPDDKKAPVKIVAKRKGLEQKDDAIVTAFYGKQDITYHIEVSPDSTFSTIGTTGDTEDTTIVLTVPEGILWWRVSAVNEGGASDWSLPLRFIVDTTPPAIPVPIEPLDTLYTTDIQFTWHASTDDLSGLMYYILTCWSREGFLEIDTLTDTTITLATEAGDYSFTVSALDSAGNVSISDTTSFSVRLIILPTPVPVSPPNDTIMARVNYITFSWTPGKESFLSDRKKRSGHSSLNTRATKFSPMNSKDYMYEIRFSHDSTFSDIGIIDTTSETSIIENLWEGYVYWQVRAIDSSGNISLWSNPWRLVLDTTRPQIPYLVYPPDSAVIETNSVHFIWKSSSDFTGIDHYLLGYEHYGGDTSEFYSVTTIDTEMVINGLENGEWKWYVNAYDSAGNYKFSGYRHFTINYLPPLPAPTIVQPTGNQWLPPLVVLKWRIDSTKSKGEKDAYYFIVQVMSGEPVFTDTVAGDTLFTFLPSGNYTWHVRTYQNGRTSEWSPVDSFRVDGYAPHPPEPISPCNGCYINTLSVDFVWSSTTDSLSGLAGYRLTIADNPDMMNPVLDTLLQDTTFSMSGLYEGEWYWQVGGEDSVGNYASYDIQVFYIDTTPPEPVILVSPPDSFLYGFGDLPVFIWHPTEGLIKKMGKEVYYELWITDGDTLVYPELVDTSLWMDTLLADGWYNWFVRAYDEHGNFSQSEVRVFGFDNTPPVIESTTVIHDTSFRGPYLIRTYAYDENGLSYIKLFYGFNERLTDSIPMTADTLQDHYYCYIPMLPDSFNDTVRVIYYIMALDNAHEPNEAYDPPEGGYVFHVYPVSTNEDVLPAEFSISVRSVMRIGKPEFGLSVPITDMVDISIYSVDGRKTFGLRKNFDAGYHRLILSRDLPDGIYFLEAKYRDKRIRRKIIVIR